MLGTSRTGNTTTTGGGQKFVILQSRSQTPTASNINSGTIQQQQSQTQQQQVKIAQSNVNSQKPHLQNVAPKLVVVCMSNSTHTNTSVTQVCNYEV